MPKKQNQSQANPFFIPKRGGGVYASPCGEMPQMYSQLGTGLTFQASSLLI